MVYVLEETEESLPAHPVSLVLGVYASIDGAKHHAAQLATPTISWRDTKYGSVSSRLPDDRRFFIWPFEIEP